MILTCKKYSINNKKKYVFKSHKYNATDNNYLDIFIMSLLLLMK